MQNKSTYININVYIIKIHGRILYIRYYIMWLCFLCSAVPIIPEKTLGYVITIPKEFTELWHLGRESDTCSWP